MQSCLLPSLRHQSLRSYLPSPQPCLLPQKSRVPRLHLLSRRRCTPFNAQARNRVSTSHQRRRLPSHRHWLESFPRQLVLRVRSTSCSCDRRQRRSGTIRTCHLQWSLRSQTPTVRPRLRRANSKLRSQQLSLPHPLAVSWRKPLRQVYIMDVDHSKILSEIARSSPCCCSRQNGNEAELIASVYEH
jgi:hypothetical protein